MVLVFSSFITWFTYTGTSSTCWTCFKASSCLLCSSANGTSLTSYCAEMLPTKALKKTKWQCKAWGKTENVDFVIWSVFGLYLVCIWSFSELWSIFQSPTPTQMAFTGVTYAQGPSPQPTACRSLSCSLMTVTGSNQALRQDLTYLAWEVWGGCGEQSFGMSDLSYFLWKVSVIQLIWRGTLSCSTIQPTQIHNKYFGHNWQKCKYIRGPFEKVSCKSNFNKTSEWTFLVLWFKISRYFMAYSVLATISRLSTPDCT